MAGPSSSTRRPASSMPPEVLELAAAEIPRPVDDLAAGKLDGLVEAAVGSRQRDALFGERALELVAELAGIVRGGKRRPSRE